MLLAMRALPLITFLALSASSSFGQATSVPAIFDVASVRQSQHVVGPDYNNQIKYLATGITARNATLRRLIAEAYRLQMNQISGPDWLDHNEYDIEAKAAAAVSPKEMEPALQRLLADRFKLREHRETREMRVYELAASKSGAKIHSSVDVAPVNSGAGFHFHGDMREFADLLAIKLAIPSPNDSSVPVRASGPPVPVLDQTGMSGVFDFGINIQPELGTDMFTLWQRALQEQLGLRLENRKGNVEILVIDSAGKIPTEN